MSKVSHTLFNHSLPEVWGGVECTISRIGNEYRDQLHDAGHYNRDSDIHEIANLNIASLRYPVLWEKHQPDLHHEIDWSWATRQLDTIKGHGIKPIVGLLHHGSGPAFTDLLDPQFPKKFAEYALLVARQFPWVDQYIPINEPLTTARFSCLYAHWYPHKNTPGDFARALISQLKASVLAMKKIRTVNPSAQFIQTEDLTRIHSSPMLAYQAEFENNRRRLTYDLLSGKVTPPTPMWTYLLSVGITREELAFFIDNACTPDILGLNYYVTSERFLDEDIAKYDPWHAGGNGIHQYVDTEAVRVGKSVGIYALLQETWERFRRPMAMTEVHIGCTCDEQIRWFAETWNACNEIASEGVDIRAVTAWSLLGAYDWDSLLTRSNFNYERGAYDLASGNLMSTNLADVIREIATTGSCSHPALASKGWWHHVHQHAEVFNPN